MGERDQRRHPGACLMSPPSSSRSAAPNWARTPGDRTRANSMSSSRPTPKVDQDRGAERRCARSWRTIRACRPRSSTFLGDRISESLTGETADIAVKVFGDQLDALDATAPAHRRRPDAARPASPTCSSSRKAAPPPSRFSSIPAALAANGLKMQDVLDAVQTEYRRHHGGPDLCRHPHRGCHAAVAGTERATGPSFCLQLMIASPFGPVPLSQVARVAPTDTRYQGHP